jgi:hypothetical protein
VKRLLVVATLAVTAIIGIGALADATQTRPDNRPDPRSATAITFEVDTQRYPRNAEPGHALWLAARAPSATRPLS